jgi:hypothetical protein
LPNYRLLILEDASKAGNRKKLQVSEYNKAIINNLPIPLIPVCEETDKEPKATKAVAALKSTALAILDCNGFFNPVHA